MHLVRNIGRGPLVVHDLSIKPLQAGQFVSVPDITAGLRQALHLGLVTIESQQTDATDIAAPVVESVVEPVAEPEMDASVGTESGTEPDPEPTPEPEAEQSVAPPEPTPEPVTEVKTDEVDTSQLPVAEATDWIAEQTDADLLTRATSRDRRYTVKRAVQRRLQALNEQSH